MDMELLLGIAIGMIFGLVGVGCIISLVMRWANKHELDKATNLNARQRALNREVARAQLGLVRSAGLYRSEVEEDQTHTLAHLYFDNGYTLTIACAHSHMATIVKATEE